MRLHFFTVNDIEDYHKNYRFSVEARELIKNSKAQTTEDFDQEFFYKFIKNTFGVSNEAYESQIYGETGIYGLRLDFNFGLRLDVPEGNFRVKISDFDSGENFFDKYISGGRLLSVEQYFIRWQVEVFLNEEKIFSHIFNPEGKDVAIILGEHTALGDTLAFLPYFREFKRIHKCNLVISLPNAYRELIAYLYPDLPQIHEKDPKTYATYYPLMLMSKFPLIPVDIRHMPLNRVGGMILGIDYFAPKPVFKPTAPPVTNDPYVCIALQARNARKSWHWPGGWDIVVDYLKSLGYRVFCIDKNAKEENDGYTVCKPDGAEDFTGDRSLIERANMLYHAQFFIGLGSGLSWLANAVDCPVVMICGFTQDWCEFYTPYRVANRKGCSGCMNDLRVYFFNEATCPYHEGTPRALECQKTISPRMVIDAIERLIVDKNLTPPALKEKFL